MPNLIDVYIDPPTERESPGSKLERRGAAGGRPARDERSAFGMESLPGNIPVEVQIIFEIKGLTGPYGRRLEMDARGEFASHQQQVFPLLVLLVMAIDMDDFRCQIELRWIGA